MTGACAREYIHEFCSRPETLPLIRQMPGFPNDTWGDGGCAALALALNLIFPEVRLYGIRGIALNHDGLWHVVSVFRGSIIDSDSPFESNHVAREAVEWARHHQLAIRSCSEISPRGLYSASAYRMEVRPVARALCRHLLLMTISPHTVSSPLSPSLTCPHG